MGTKSKKKKDRPRINHKGTRQEILDRMYRIADAASQKAEELVLSGEDIRGNDERPGLSTWMFATSKALDEIVRLTPLCETQEDGAAAGNVIGWEYNPEDERVLLELVAKADA